MTDRAHVSAPTDRLSTELDDEQLAAVAGGIGPGAAGAGTSFYRGAVSDQLSSLNTKTQRYLTEAHDADARVASLLSDYKSLLQEMRK